MAWVAFRWTAVGEAGGGREGVGGVNTAKDMAKPTMDGRGPSRLLELALTL